MKITLISLIGLLLTFGTYAQNNGSPADQVKEEQTRVKQWLEEHPEVKIVSLDQFLSASSSEQHELTNASPRLLHENAIPTWNEIEVFEASGYAEGVLNMESLYLESQNVEQWVAQHPEVKLIEMGTFQSLPSNKRAYYLSLNNVIIYQSHLRQEDIDAFESN